MEWLGNLFKWPGWGGIGSIALIVTLIVIIIYTRATRSLAMSNEALAKSSRDMAKVQNEEIGLAKRPIIKFGLELEDSFYSRITVKNLSLVHAKIRVVATIIVNKKKMELWPEHHYAGELVWQLQAMGPNDPSFKGHLAWDEVFERNNFPHPDLGDIKAQISIEAWVINFYEDESRLYKPENKNPVAQWYWRGRWIPEVSPKNIS
jgi:hypothetical protein